MKTSLHNRSNSVPSAPHPFTSQFEEHVRRLKASEAASSSSSSSLSQKLNDLQHLHDCTDKMLQLPTTQQNLAQESCKAWVDELLEGSLRLLDICSTGKNVLLESKESIHELQSALRRKRSGEIALKTEGSKYLSSRKIVRKAIRKALENFKVINKELILTSSNKDSESVSMISNLKEAEVITLSQLESVLSFTSGSRGQTRGNRWSVVSKLMQPIRIGNDDEQSNANSFDEVDGALQSLLCHKSCSSISVESFQHHVENLKLCIQVLEAGIDHLQRQFIRTRVSLLNICNH